MVEGARLLSGYMVKSRIVGSNPILSASPRPFGSFGRHAENAGGTSVSRPIRFEMRPPAPCDVPVSR